MTHGRHCNWDAIQVMHGWRLAGTGARQNGCDPWHSRHHARPSVAIVTARKLTHVRERLRSCFLRENRIMNRRDFLKATAATAALTTFGAHVAGAADTKTYRVGLIGAGWFGKLDMCRLIQVAPVEV